MDNIFKRIKNEPDLHYAWQANIAMAFKDEFWRRKNTNKTLIDVEDDLHEMANQAAKNFLDQLTYEPKYMSCLNDIDTDSKEGKYLMAALVLLTVTSRTDRTPDEVVKELTNTVDYMYYEQQSIL